LDETEDDLSRLQGLTAHPNSLGSFAAMMLTFLIGAVYLGYVRRGMWLSVGMLGVATIVAAQSRTSVIALVVASVFQIPRRFLLPLLALGGVFAVIVSMSGGTTEIYRMLGRGGSAQEAETMSGRTELWAFTEELIAKRPLLGYGFQSFEVYAPTQWTGETRSDVVGPHNNYLNLLYNSGVIGAVPFVATFVILLARWWTTPFLPRDLYVFSVLVGSYAEAELPNNAVVPTLSFFLILALDARRRAVVQGRVLRLRQFLADWQQNMVR
jgi:O-antigen ligase